MDDPTSPSTPPAVPLQPLSYAPASMPGQGMMCPQCGQYAGRPVSFTLWGGVLGPKLLNHHRCEQCRYTFNGKTGRSNNTAIWIYRLVGCGLLAGVLLFRFSRR